MARLPLRPATYNADDTVTIYLTRGYTATIDKVDDDLARFNWRAEIYPKWGIVYAARKVRTGVTSESSIHVLLHRIILSRILGRDLLVSELVDHKDTNGTNNTRSNLRLATVSHNAQNKRLSMSSTSHFKGVTWNKKSNKWQASIKLNGRSCYLGLFNSPEEAHEAYKQKAADLFGEFARFK